MPDLAEIQALIDSGALGASDGVLADTSSAPIGLRDGPKMGSRVEGSYDNEGFDAPEADSKSLDEFRQKIKTAEAAAKQEYANPQPEEKHTLPFDPHLESLVYRTTGRAMKDFDSAEELIGAISQDKDIAVRLEFIRRHPEWPHSAKNGNAVEQFLTDTGLPATVENLEYAYESLKELGVLEPSVHVAPPVQHRPIQHRPTPTQRNVPQMSDAELRKLTPGQLRDLIAQEAQTKGVRSGLTISWDDF